METSVTQAIGGIEILNWFHSGALAVRHQKKYLNAINVFPVADGDTGTNMVSTLQAMVEYSEPHRLIFGNGPPNCRGRHGLCPRKFRYHLCVICKRNGHQRPVPRHGHHQPVRGDCSQSRGLPVSRHRKSHRRDHDKRKGTGTKQRDPVLKF